MRSLFLLLFSLSFLSAYAQVQTVTFQPDYTDGQDAHVSSAAGTSNYSTSSSFRVGTLKGTIQIYPNPPSNYDYYMRSFIKFDDLASIPSNAVILEAKIHLSRYDATYSSGHSNAAYLTPLNSSISWDESTITFSNMPSISEIYVAINNDAAISSVSSSTETWEVYDVTNTVDYFVNNPSSNEGWELRLDEEDPSGSTYSNYRFYRASNYSTDASKRPKLEVTYYLPPPEITGTVTHSEYEMNNGAIDATVSGGTPPYVSYDWYDGQTDTYFATTQDVSDLAPGWYGLKVEDDEGIIGTQIFVVGEECKKSTIVIDPPEDFGKDITIMNGEHSNQNTNSSVFLSGYLQAMAPIGQPQPPPYAAYGLWGFDIMGLWDAQNNLIFPLQSAQAKVYESSRNNIISGVDYFGKLITESWVEENTVYSNAPAYTSNSNDWEDYNFINNSGIYSAELDVLDYLSDDGEVSFYSFLDISSAGYTTSSRYSWALHSSDASNALYRPTMTVTIGEICQSVQLKYEDELDGQFYDINQGGYLIFEYDEEYNVSELIFEIYDAETGDIVKNQDNLLYSSLSIGDNRIAFNFGNPSNTISSGYYILKVTDPKGEIRKLRFYIH